MTASHDKEHRDPRLDSPEQLDAELDFGPTADDQQWTDTVAGLYTEVLVLAAGSPQHIDHIRERVTETLPDIHTVVLRVDSGSVHLFRTDSGTQLTVYRGYAVTEVTRPEFDSVLDALLSDQ